MSSRHVVAVRCAVVVAAMAFVLVGAAPPAFADNCGDLSDCSPSILAAILLLGGLLGLAVAVAAGSSMSSGGAGSGSGAGGGGAGGAAGGGGAPGPAPGTNPSTPPKAPPAYDPNYVPPKADANPQQQQAIDAARQRLADKVGQGPESWVNDINPTGDVNNCVEAAKAVDQTLGKNPTVAGPVRRGQDGYEIENAYPGRPMSPTTPGGIEQQLTSAGPGSRGIVTVTEGGNSHAFNAYNDNGTIKWIDGQTGKVATSPGGALAGMPYDSNGSYTFLRTFP